MAGEGPDYDGRVTLSPRASVVRHFVQLLGRDPALYFDVSAVADEDEGSPAEIRSSMSWRTVTLDRVMRPWERNLVTAQQHWARVRQENADKADKDQ